MIKLGFIGCGAMAGAMIEGILDSGAVDKEHIMASALTEASRQRARDRFGIFVAKDNRQVVEFAEVLFLAVKPQYYYEVISEIKDQVRQDQRIVSIAAGWTLEMLEDAFRRSGLKILRAMPNTPAKVGAGMTAVCGNDQVTDQETKEVVDLMASFGGAELLPEKLFDAVVGVSGSAPAYVFLFIEALADAAVMKGMKRDAAYRFASRAVMGAGKMALESGLHPGELKDQVCSPAGTTIEAVRELEEGNFRSTVIEAALSAMERSEEMTEDLEMELEDALDEELEDPEDLD